MGSVASVRSASVTPTSETGLQVLTAAADKQGGVKALVAGFDGTFSTLAPEGMGPGYTRLFALVE